MNIELHGCVDVEGAIDLCQMGFITPVLFAGTGIGDRPLRFQAVERELIAHIESGSMLAALAVEHPFIVEAKERMNIDQFHSHDVVVFDAGYLSKLTSMELAIAYERAAKNW